MAARARRSGGIEWATLGLFAAFYAAWLAVVLLHRSLPWPASLAALALLGGFYMSLQHEALHGHPTSRRGVNTALAFAPLSFWLPYLGYRSSHMVHHHTDLTDPEIDPESFYLNPVEWSSAGAVKRSYILVTRTMVGRLTDRFGAQHRSIPVARGAHSRIDAAGGQAMGSPRSRCRRRSAGGCSWSSVSRSGSTCWDSSSWDNR